jgi:hypothetical protein
VSRLNRISYLYVVTGYEPLSSDGKRHLAIFIASELRENEDKLKRKQLGKINESIPEAIAYHVLVGPDVGNFVKDVSLEVR